MTDVESEWKVDFDPEIVPLIWANLKVILIFLFLVFCIRFALPKNEEGKAMEGGIAAHLATGFAKMVRRKNGQNLLRKNWGKLI